jgi:cytochrome oxidase Cu insertion factor (SCO1/SenC/PrrC family)/uncharacterized membrane protein YozB (DUF420 family)
MPDDDLGQVGEFALTDQDGRTMTRHDLEGKVWVASFFFTRCATVCPQITGTMAHLQHDLAGQRDVILISFSVDPKHDTPEVLQEYAARYQADARRWHFLTGPQDDIYSLIQKSFMLAVAANTGEARTPGNEVSHSTRLALVDRRGHIRGYFDGRQVDEEGQPVHDLARLESRIAALMGPNWPAINASLNATCTLLLILGFTAIRRRQIRLHAVSMLAALTVSALFLASYLYYHLAIKFGKPTPFLGEGVVRVMYFALLYSHMALAGVVVPLALVTAYRGLRGQLAGHVRLARWTLPLWMYVSVTGVVVYWMLYRLYPPS